MASLRNLKLTASDGRLGNTCMICLNILQVTQYVTEETGGNHTYHYNCLRRLRSGDAASGTRPFNVCPECRALLPHFNDHNEPIAAEAFQLQNLPDNLDQTIHRTPVRRG